MATELEKAKAAYTKGSARVKTALENIFGKAAFVPKITDRVKTFDDACKVIGLKPDDYGTLHTPKQITQYQKHLYAHLKLMIIAEALNEGWKPNWDDSSEWKYYPYFDMRSKGAGFGFSVARARLRVSAPAFVSKMKSWPPTQVSSLWNCIRIY
jgi:hypothetical protein